MRPSLDGEIGLSIEADAEDDDGEETGDVVRELPVLPFSGLSWWRRGSIEKVTVGSFLVPGACPSAWPFSPASPCTERRLETTSEHS